MSDAEAFFDAEEERLLTLLRTDHRFVQLEAIRFARIAYSAAQQHKVRGRPRPDTQTERGLTGSAKYLDAIGRRATAREIADYLHEQNVITESGPRMTKTVAAYLSAADDTFDNVKGPEGGYGLCPHPDRPRPRPPVV